MKAPCHEEEKVKEEKEEKEKMEGKAITTCYLSAEVIYKFYQALVQPHSVHAAQFSCSCNRKDITDSLESVLRRISEMIQFRRRLKKLNLNSFVRSRLQDVLRFLNG